MSLIETIYHYQRKINRNPEDCKALKRALYKLSQLSHGITYDVLKETSIGMSVNSLKKHEDQEVAEQARSLVNRWKQIVSNEEAKEETDEHSDDEHSNETVNKELSHHSIREDNGNDNDDIEEEIEEPPKKRYKEDKEHRHHKSKSRKSEKRDKGSSEADERKRKKHKKSSDRHDRSDKDRSEKEKRKSSKSESSSSKSSHKAHSHKPSNAFDLALGKPEAKKSKHFTNGHQNLPSSSTSQINSEYSSTLESTSNSLLPNLAETTPFYKPLPSRKENSHRMAAKNNIGSKTEDEMLSELLSRNKSKQSRTAVYSGVKRSRAGLYGSVPTLKQLCITILQDHVDSIEECGNLGYDILEPVLERASAETLMKIEEYNPHLMDSTFELWQKFCKKSFPKEEREDMENWREMYERCTSEREDKLNMLKLKVKEKYLREKSDLKKVKLAYVGTNAKPPRNVIRAQAKNGTGLGIGTPIDHKAPRPGLSTMPKSSVPRKPKTAPMMAKSLKMMRGMLPGFRR